MSAERGRRYRSDDERLFEKLDKSLVLLRLNTLVVAEQQIGSQVADVLAARLQSSGQAVRRIGAGPINSVFGLLRHAGEPESLTVTEGDWFGLLYTLAATSHQDDQPRFIVIDRIPDPRNDWQLFGRRRDDLWEIHYRWAVFIKPDELVRYTTPPADTFFPTIIRISDVG